MTINTLAELMEVVEERRADTLTLEVDLGGGYSSEHEEAKAKLKQAEGLQMLTGQSFLSDNLEQLKQEVENTKPKTNSVLLRFKRIGALQWSALLKNTKVTTPLEQFEKVLTDTFVGVFGEDSGEPLTTDYKLVSPSSPECILPGGAMQSVIQAFTSWQNSGGEVTLHPTKSGHV